METATIRETQSIATANGGRGSGLGFDEDLLDSLATGLLLFRWQIATELTRLN